MASAVIAAKHVVWLFVGLLGVLAAAFLSAMAAGLL